MICTNFETASRRLAASRKYPNKFGISLDLHYLCTQKIEYVILIFIRISMTYA